MQIFKFSYVFVFLFFCVSLLSCTPKEHSSSVGNSSENAENSTSENASSSNTENSNSEDTESNQNEEGNYTFSYKMGIEPKKEDKGKTLSVSLSKIGLGKKGQETYHSLFSFRVHYQNKISLKFDINDEAVVETMNKEYTFTSYEQVRDFGLDTKNFMTVMVVDAEGKSQPFASKTPTMAQVNFDGKNLKISIKGATVTGMQDDEVTVPFEFELDAKNVEVKKKGF
jgi:hypothetical protein